MELVSLINSHTAGSPQASTRFLLIFADFFHFLIATSWSGLYRVGGKLLLLFWERMLGGLCSQEGRGS